MIAAENNTTEQHIIEVAMQVFIEKGFAETSMSDIATRAGINRPVLHYYFRTKERLYETIYTQIVSNFLPTALEVISQNKPLAERITEVVNVYFSTMEHEPLLPLFVAREIQRDASHFLNTIKGLEIGEYATQLQQILHDEIKRGIIRPLPLEYMFYNFYGLIFVAFLARPLTDIIFPKSEDEKQKTLMQWKSQIARQLIALLCVDDNTSDC